ncbi:MAG: dUTP diphosphatase [Oscillospiraceae bacterium]|nr:dUTP diphosphatase [Oscillospiraceae bacterium]
MNSLSVKFTKPNAKLPVRKTAGSVGFDIFACLGAEAVIAPGETKKVGAGFAMALEPGFAAFIYARSGLGVDYGIAPANCVGVIDSDYRGEVTVGLRNSSNVPFVVRDGERIAQMVICRCELPELVLCEALDETARGSGGFGSTGED